MFSLISMAMENPSPDRGNNVIIRDKILENRYYVAERVLKRLWDRFPSLEQQYSKKDKKKCRDDVIYHLMYLANSAGSASEELFLHYTGWVKVLFHSLGVPKETFLLSLEFIRDELRDYLESVPEGIACIERIINRSIEEFPDMPEEHASYINPENPYAELAVTYLHAVIEGKRHEAGKLVVTAVEGGTSVKDIYLHVFQPTQQEIGRLWQMNRISVAQEHYATAVTQLVMSRLYPYIFSEEKNGNTFIGTCVGDELHEIGIRMLTDFFEIEGWDTYFLGANTPASAVIDSLKEYEADIIGISATMTYHVNKVEELISAIHAEKWLKRPQMLVGGYPFNRDKELYKRVGADGFAENALDALQAGRDLVHEEQGDEK
jgi:MerR family transcriptional regulator, light-induced transcriptional regulator